MFNFNNVIGQTEVKQQLLHEIQGNHLPHALLLCGPTGCGKLPLALALAHYLSCPEHSATEPCGKCRQCVQWDKLVHPDVHFMFPIVSSEKRKKTTCDDYLPLWRQCLIQNPYLSMQNWLKAMEAENSQAIIYAKESDEITKKLNLKSAEGGYKTCIIWLPEKMHEACANKMLKLLEEPPQMTVFILVSEEPELILPTILSRTQRINMPRIKEEDIMDTLQNHYGVSQHDSETLAHLANGSFTKVLETINFDGDDEENLEFFIDLMRLAYQRKVREMKQWSEQAASLGRERQKALLTYFQHMVRESFIANFHQRDMSYMNLKEENFTERFAPFINERNVTNIMHEINEAQVHIEQNVNAKMVFFDFALKLIVLLKQ